MLFAQQDPIHWNSLIQGVMIGLIPSLAAVFYAVAAYIQAKAASVKAGRAADSAEVAAQRSADNAVHLNKQDVIIGNVEHSVTGKVAEIKDVVRTLATSSAAADDSLGMRVDNVWNSLIKRGFLEASQLGHLKQDNIMSNNELVSDGNKWVISDSARKVYSEIEGRLGEIYREQKTKNNRAPNDAELAWAIESEFQDWLISHACPTLRVNQHGCLAIASIIASDVGGAG